MNRGFVNALEMLPVSRTPDPTWGRGARGCCLWCGEEASLSLGPRLKIIDGALQCWMPRSCADCAESQASLAHKAHRATCARCTEWEHCPDSRALHRLALGRLDGLIREG